MASREIRAVVARFVGVGLESERHRSAVAYFPAESGTTFLRCAGQCPILPRFTTMRVNGPGLYGLLGSLPGTKANAFWICLLSGLGFDGVRELQGEA